MASKYTINYLSDTVGYLDVTFGPTWDYIPVTRSYIENFLSVHMSERNDISAIEMAASELLENAVKYSKADGIRVIIDKDERKKTIELRVFNYSAEESANKLISKINKMNESDPLEYYIEKLRESKKHKETNKSAGVGLARIYSEGEGKITADFDQESQILLVRAIFSIS